MPCKQRVLFGDGSRRSGQRLLKDSTGHYVRSAEDVDRLLSAHAYAWAWPRIPQERSASACGRPSHFVSADFLSVLVYSFACQALLEMCEGREVPLYERVVA